MRSEAPPGGLTTAEAAATPAAAMNAALSAIVFRAVLAPLTAALGPAGDVVAGSIADELFVTRSHALRSPSAPE